MATPPVRRPEDLSPEHCIGSLIVRVERVSDEPEEVLIGLEVRAPKPKPVEDGDAFFRALERAISRHRVRLISLDLVHAWPGVDKFDLASNGRLTVRFRDDLDRAAAWASLFALREAAPVTVCIDGLHRGVELR